MSNLNPFTPADASPHTNPAPMNNVEFINLLVELGVCGDFIHGTCTTNTLFKHGKLDIQGGSKNFRVSASMSVLRTPPCWEVEIEDSEGISTHLLVKCEGENSFTPTPPKNGFDPSKLISTRVLTFTPNEFANWLIENGLFPGLSEAKWVVDSILGSKYGMPGVKVNDSAYIDLVRVDNESFELLIQNGSKPRTKVILKKEKEMSKVYTRVEFAQMLASTTDIKYESEAQDLVDMCLHRMQSHHPVHGISLIELGFEGSVREIEVSCFKETFKVDNNLARLTHIADYTGRTLEEASEIIDHSFRLGGRNAGDVVRNIIESLSNSPVGSVFSAKINLNYNTIFYRIDNSNSGNVRFLVLGGVGYQTFEIKKEPMEENTTEEIPMDETKASIFDNVISGLRMKQLVRKLEKTETPQEAFALLTTFLGEDTEFAGKIARKDTVIAYSFEYNSTTRNIKADIMVGNKEHSVQYATNPVGEPMFALKLNLTDKNVDTLYKSVVSLLELYK